MSDKNFKYKISAFTDKTMSPRDHDQLKALIDDFFKKKDIHGRVYRIQCEKVEKEK